MRRFSFDFETSLVCPGLQAPPVVCMVWAFDDLSPDLHHIRTGQPGFDSLYGSSRRMKDILLEALRDDQCAMVAYNASYEAVVTMAQWPDLAELVWRKHDLGLWHCPYEREKLIRIAQGNHRDVMGLDETLKHYKVPVFLDKKSPWRIRYGELIDTPISQWPKDAVEYAASDIAVRDVDVAQRAKYPLFNYADYALQQQAALSFALTKCRGFMTDLEASRKLYQDTQVRIEQAKEICLVNGLAAWEKKGGQLRVKRSKKPAEERITKAYAAQGLEVPRGEPTEVMLKKAYADNDGEPNPGDDARKMKADLLSHGIEVQGNISLDEDACELSKDPVLVAYSEFGRAQNLLSRVHKFLLAAEHGMPTQTSYNTIVNTGRSSARQGATPEPGEPYSAYGVQIQNLPRSGELVDAEALVKEYKRGARECLIARPGYAVVSVDMDAFEMRTWTWVNSELFGIDNCALAGILNNPARCPHTEMGARLYAASGREMTVEMAYLLRGDEKKALRGLAKGPNFGLPGGMGAKRLLGYCYQSYGVDISLEMAETMCSVWREIYPEADPYLQWVKDQVGRRYGSRAQIKQFWSNRLRGDVGYCDAANGYFQALAADIAKLAGYRCAREAYKVGGSLYGSFPLAFIHDEWVYEVPLHLLHEHGHRIAQIMTETAMEICKGILFTAAPAAMLAYSKSAGDPVFLDGRLAVYEDWLKARAA